MQLVFSDQSLPDTVTRSIFLEGPSIRSSDQRDWRHRALAILEAIEFDGHVLIPIPEGKFYGGEDTAAWSYTGQISWECEAREFADCVLCWVPRHIDRTRKDLGAPALTTNVEFGEDVHSGKLIYGRPDSSEKNRYLDARAQALGIVVHTSLEDTIRAAVAFVGPGVERRGGEVHVPLFIWHTPQFQSWYDDLKLAGNRLDGARVMHHVAVGQKVVFAYLLRVNVWVEKEQRSKTNEFIFARRDISAVLAYHVDACDQMKVLLVREFRSTVSNGDGFVYELPGGSALKPDVPAQVSAQEELSEETGLVVTDLNRFRPVSKRQLMATVSSHKAALFAIRLTDDELESLEDREQDGRALGAPGESERTYLKVVPLRDLHRYPVDFSTMGMVYEGLRPLIAHSSCN